MASAKIYFSDKSILVVNESDRIIPIVQSHSEKGDFASMGASVELYNHIHDGLIPSLMDAFCFCDYFYVNENGNTVYSSHSIVKIENC